MNERPEIGCQISSSNYELYQIRTSTEIAKLAVSFQVQTTKKIQISAILDAITAPKYTETAGNFGNFIRHYGPQNTQKQQEISAILDAITAPQIHRKHQIQIQSVNFSRHSKRPYILTLILFIQTL